MPLFLVGVGDDVPNARRSADPEGEEWTRCGTAFASRDRPGGAAPSTVCVDGAVVGGTLLPGAAPAGAQAGVPGGSPPPGGGWDSAEGDKLWFHTAGRQKRAKVARQKARDRARKGKRSARVGKSGGKAKGRADLPDVHALQGVFLGTQPNCGAPEAPGGGGAEALPPAEVLDEILHATGYYSRAVTNQTRRRSVGQQQQQQQRDEPASPSRGGGPGWGPDGPWSFAHPFRSVFNAGGDSPSRRARVQREREEAETALPPTGRLVVGGMSATLDTRHGAGPGHAEPSGAPDPGRTPMPSLPAAGAVGGAFPDRGRSRNATRCGTRGASRAASRLTSRQTYRDAGKPEGGGVGRPTEYVFVTPAPVANHGLVFSAPQHTAPVTLTEPTTVAHPALATLPALRAVPVAAPRDKDGKPVTPPGTAGTVAVVSSPSIEEYTRLEIVPKELCSGCVAQLNPDYTSMTHRACTSKACPNHPHKAQRHAATHPPPASRQEAQRRGLRDSVKRKPALRPLVPLPSTAHDSIHEVTPCAMALEPVPRTPTQRTEPIDPDAPAAW